MLREALQQADFTRDHSVTTMNRQSCVTCAASIDGHITISCASRLIVRAAGDGEVSEDSTR